MTNEEEKRQLQAKIDELTAKLETADRLNENLQRICKERANQQRKIKPKTDAGYRLVARGTKTDTIRHGNGDKMVIPAYITTIETPISAELSVSEVQHWLQTDKGWAEYIGKYFYGNIENYDTAEYSKKENIRKSIKDTTKNTAYRYDMRTNRQGFWEITITHSQDFLPRYLVLDF